MNYNIIDIPGHAIVRKIGEGGMGTVYLAMDNMLQRQVAVKALKSDAAMERESMLRFQTEAVTLAKLRHPNITMLYNLVQTNGYQCMIMEYVEGDTLESLLKSKGILPVEQVLAIAIRTLDGLKHAHDKGVIHRDMKPSNLMLSTDGEVKIMDFGIARIAGGSRLTRVGQAVGTPQYMSPEQVRGQEGNYASDIYSFGIVLYELLTGTTPFDSDVEYEIMHAHTSRKPVPPVSLNPAIPEALNRAILKALEKDPLHRFGSAGEFRLCLQQINEQIAVGTSSQKPVQKLSPKASGIPVGVGQAYNPLKTNKVVQWIQRQTWNRSPFMKIDPQYLIGIGFLVLSLLAALFVLFRNPNNEPSGSISEKTISEKEKPQIEIEPNIDMSTIMQSQSPVETVASSQRSSTANPVTVGKETVNPVVPAQTKKEKQTPPEPKEKEKEKEKKQENLTKVESPPQKEPDVIAKEPEKTSPVVTQPTEQVNPQANASIGKQVVIPRGTPLTIVMDNSYEYDSAPDGVRINLSVAESFERSGRTVVRVGAKVHAVLRKNTKRRELEFEIINVESVTGKNLQALKTTYRASAFRQGERFKMNLDFDRID